MKTILIKNEELLKISGGQSVPEICSEIAWWFGFGLGMAEWHITTGNAGWQIAIYRAN